MYTDILILAHLSSEPHHGYELKQHVEQTMGGTLNNNHLYPALRRFEEMGAIVREVERQSGRPDRHIYRITERGTEVLQGLLHDFPAHLAHSDDEFLTRVSFFHLLEPEARVDILTKRQDFLLQRQQRFAQFQVRVDGLVPDFRYAVYILHFQQQQTQQELDWVTTLIKEENI